MVGSATIKFPDIFNYIFKNVILSSTNTAWDHYLKLNAGVVARSCRKGREKQLWHLAVTTDMGVFFFMYRRNLREKKFPSQQNTLNMTLQRKEITTLQISITWELIAKSGTVQVEHRTATGPARLIPQSKYLLKLKWAHEQGSCVVLWDVGAQECDFQCLWCKAQGILQPLTFRGASNTAGLLLSMPRDSGCSGLQPDYTEALNFWHTQGREWGMEMSLHLAGLTAPHCPSLSVWWNPPGSHWRSTTYLLLYTCNSNVETEVLTCFSLGQKCASWLEYMKVVGGRGN